jgi:DNA invertase Pin-like site-specific DNA recombinase
MSTDSCALTPPLAPRRPGPLIVLGIARISTDHQDQLSLADQEALYRRWLDRHAPGGYALTMIAGRGSGELLDRAEVEQAVRSVETGRFDLVLCEDLGRAMRRVHAILFCELCEDTGTRLIAILDQLDTARPDWRILAGFASMRHEMYNRDTAERIRRSLRHRFERGGVVQTLPYGYVKPPDAKSDADVSKDPAAEPVYAEVFRRLEDGATYAEVADWLNGEGVPTGEWARNEGWDGRMVSRVVHNPILKGVRRRNERTSKRVNKTGRRKSVKAPPADRVYRVVPHLAFVDAARYDRLIAKLAERNGACARGRAAGAADGRAGVPKKRTVWPGQHAACGVCGRLMYWGGHGQKGRMMCSGARDYACWNAATCDGSEAGRRLAAAVLAAVENLPGFDADFLARVRAAAAARQTARAEELRRLDREAAEADKELNNLLDAVAQMGGSAALRGRLAAAEARAAKLAAERADRLARPDDVPDLPPVEERKAMARAAVGRLAFDDPEFGRLMKQIVPRVVLLPHRARDDGPVVLRAVLTVNVAPLLGPAGGVVGDQLACEVTADLFDPPQRVACRERVVALRAGGATERAAAGALGLTVTAAQRAMALDRAMRAAGTADPYAPLTAPPEGDGKVRRHRHARYQFRPLAGYPVWANPAA